MNARRRRIARILGALGIGALLLPATADAHGIVGRADLPIPVWLFSWAAAIVLIVSFVALSALWTRPQLQSERRVRLFRVPAAAGVARQFDRHGAVRARALQRLRRHAGVVGELQRDVHLRDLLGRHARAERAARRCVRPAQPVALVRANRSGGSRVAWRPACSPDRRFAIRRALASGRLWRAWSASPGWSSCTSNETARQSLRRCRSATSS